MLYSLNHPYYPKINKMVDLFVALIIRIETGIYDSRWRASSRSRLSVTDRKNSDHCYDDIESESAIELNYIILSVKWRKKEIF